MAPLAECALIVAPYQVDGEAAGTIGVLGPSRMDYPQAMAAVAVVSTRLSTRPTEGCPRWPTPTTRCSRCPAPPPPTTSRRPPGAWHGRRPPPPTPIPHTVRPPAGQG